MAKYKVEYETTKKPSIYDLPVGAKIVQTSVLPVEVKYTGGMYGDVTVRVEKAATAGHARIQLKNAFDSVTARLTKAQALEVIEALKEITGA